MWYYANKEDMNGIFLVNWIEEQTETMCYEHKRAFIEEVLKNLNEYAVDFVMEHTSMDEE